MLSGVTVGEFSATEIKAFADDLITFVLNTDPKLPLASAHSYSLMLISRTEREHPSPFLFVSLKSLMLIEKLPLSTKHWHSLNKVALSSAIR